MAHINSQDTSKGSSGREMAASTKCKHHHLFNSIWKLKRGVALQACVVRHFKQLSQVSLKLPIAIVVHSTTIVSSILQDVVGVGKREAFPALLHPP